MVAISLYIGFTKKVEKYFFCRGLQAALKDRENLMEQEDRIRSLIEEADQVIKLCQAAENLDDETFDHLSGQCFSLFSVTCGGGGGFTRPIPRDGGADQFRGIPIVGRLPTDGTRGPEEKECGRKWLDAEGLVQGSRARDVRDPVVQNHSCCKKESRLDQPCGDKS